MNVDWLKRLLQKHFQTFKSDAQRAREEGNIKYASQLIYLSSFVSLEFFSHPRGHRNQMQLSRGALANIMATRMSGLQATVQVS